MRDKLCRYVELLLEWNSIHNLTGAKTKEEVWENIEDSLGALEFAPDFESACDIGSGAGFPGLILAIAKPHVRFMLIEPINKKASFLRYCVVELGLLHVKVEPKRAQDIHESFDAVFSRAVTKSTELLKICSHLCQSNGFFMFYKGENVENEVQNLKNYEIFDKNRRKYLMIRNGVSKNDF